MPPTIIPVVQTWGTQQHLRYTAPATPESAALATELARIGYRIAFVCRALPRLHERRREEVRRHRTASPSA